MFNNKKDPLVDAVKGIMEASAREREIERKLNESLGITSKKALPHELHKEYDEVLKESIAGSQINEVSEKLLKRAKQKARDKAMVAWELNDRKAEDKNKKRAEKFSKAIAKKQKMKEEKELSPKQKKLAAKAGDEDEIEAVDLKALRKDKTLDEAKATEAQKEKVAKVMREYKKGKLHSGSKKGPMVKDRKQAVAIALSQAGLSKKMDESNSFNLVQEEIRTNLLERIRHIYENEGVDAANAYFESLSEEERGILGEQTPDTLDEKVVEITPGRYSVQPNIPFYTQRAQAARAAQAAPSTSPQTIGSRISGFLKGLTNVGRTPSTTGMGAAAAAEILGPAAEKTGVTKAIGRVNTALGSPLNIANTDQPESQKNVSYPGVTRSGAGTPGAIRQATPDELKRPLGTGVARRPGSEPSASKERQQSIAAPQPTPSTPQIPEPKSVTNFGQNINRELKTPTAPVEPGAGTEFAAAKNAVPKTDMAAARAAERSVPAGNDGGPSTPSSAATPPAASAAPKPTMARPAPTPRPARPEPTSDWKKDVFDSTKIGGA